MLYSSFSPNLIEAGVDEAGRGCLAGPVVASAVILPKDYKHEWLTDSKKLNKKQREKLREEIEKEAICIAIGMASPQEIDQINILQASVLAMHRAIEKLDPQAELLLIDGKYFKPYPFTLHECIVKGDSLYLSIAAASIIAKTERDKIMEQYAQEFPMYAWEHNAGYPTKAHYHAIQTYGITPLHRQSFRLT
ncbi:MAG: ribonuclease HII [Thermoflexibacter sp.]|jgi:ribonuclease HII|nr:ribonuclease HII [Thermoflexibacter sp.]